MPIKHYQGQAIAESLVLFLVFISFFIAIPWLGRLVDIRHQQDNASRYAAFQLTRQLNGIDETEIASKFFFANPHRWKDRKNKNIIQEESVQVSVGRVKQLSEKAQAAQDLSAAQRLRREWGLQDRGIADISLRVQPIYSAEGEKFFGMDNAFLERLIIPMQRHTAILSDAGHSQSDKTAHQRTGQSDLAWKKTADDSYRLGRHIQTYASPAEGFNRAKPVFDWLMPWVGYLPKHHLQGGR